jgi:hypothetical protein
MYQEARRQLELEPSSQAGDEDEGIPSYRDQYRLSEREQQERLQNPDIGMIDQVNPYQQRREKKNELGPSYKYF